MPARPLVALLGVTCWLLLAACGRGSASVPGGAAAEATPTASAISTEHPATPAGTAVVITTDHARYTPAATVTATVANHLATSLFANDSQASCSIFGLEVKTGSGWQPSPVAHCPLGRLARVAEIKPGASLSAQITAGYPGLNQNQFPPGTYRLSLAYFTQGASSASELPGAGGPLTLIYSAMWIVSSS
jgi:hypothetical protein